MNPLLRLLLPLALLAALAGCEGALSQDLPDDASAAAAASAAVEAQSAERPLPQLPAAHSGNLLLDAAALADAQQRLSEQLGRPAEQILITGSIDFYDGDEPRIEIDLVAPDDALRSEHYIYRSGLWQRSETDILPPERKKPLPAEALSSVRFDQAAELAQAWAAKAAGVHAVVREPYYLSLMPLADGSRFWHSATIETRRGQYYLSFRRDGSVWEFKKL